MSEKQVISDAFLQITDFSWLVTAYRHARKQKRYRNEFLTFANNLDDNLHSIQDRVRDGSFVFGPYRKHWVYVPKKRLVMALPCDSRIVQWAIYDLLNPFYDRMMIEDSYACRKGKGSLAAVKRLQYWMKQVEGKPGQWYCLKLDISKYFYRVDHAVLLQILGERIKDPCLMELLDKIINCDGERFGLPRFMGPDDAEEADWLADVGMPIGNLTSQLFANIYLDQLDQFCKHVLHIHCYIRYMDDVIILAETKEQSHAYRLAIEAFLKTMLRLDLNRKTAIFPAKRIEFVGYMVTSHELRLRKATVRRIKEAMRAISRKLFTGEMTKQDFDRRVASYKGMIQHCTNAGLRDRLNEIYLHAKERYGGNNQMGTMSHLQIIQAMSEIIEKQNAIIRAQADSLQQLGAVCMEEETRQVNQECHRLLGIGEAPDEFDGEEGT